jgi:hypothetical protein
MVNNETTWDPANGQIDGGILDAPVYELDYSGENCPCCGGKMYYSSYSESHDSSHFCEDCGYAKRRIYSDED